MAVVTEATFQDRLRELVQADAPGVIARIDALAAAAGVNRRTVYDWIGGHTQPRASAVVAVAAFYAVTTDDLLGAGA